MTSPLSLLVFAYLFNIIGFMGLGYITGIEIFYLFGTGLSLGASIACWHGFIKYRKV